MYVYLVYGMHWLLNFSTAGAGNPEGVLIRAIMVEENGSPRFVVGPGLVTRYLEIDKRQDGLDATTSASCGSRTATSACAASRKARASASTTRENIGRRVLGGFGCIHGERGPTKKDDDGA